MINEAHISLAGFIATQPVAKTIKPGVVNLTMRVAWTPRWQDRVTGEWVDGVTSYLTVICWRKLASNAAVCLRKGDPVVVKGRLTVRPYEKDGITRQAVEVDASAIGHDLSHGIAGFQRVRPQTGLTASEYAASKAAGGTPGADPGGGGAVPGLPDGSAAACQPGAFGSPWAAVADAGGCDAQPGDDDLLEDEAFFDERAISGPPPEEEDGPTGGAEQEEMAAPAR